MQAVLQLPEFELRNYLSRKNLFSNFIIRKKGSQSFLLSHLLGDRTPLFEVCRNKVFVVRLFVQLVICIVKKPVWSGWLSSCSQISSDSSANGVKIVSRGYNFKVFLLKEMSTNAILSSLSLFHSVYWCTDYNW